MDLKENLERLESFSEFKEWKSASGSYCLVHAFVMLDEINKDCWQIGFYSGKEGKMATFILEPDDIKMAETTEIFKEPGSKILELNPSDVKITVEKALQIADAVLKEKYPKNSIMKKFFIIQNLEKEGPVFNVTFVSQEMNTINIKISTSTGHVMKHQISSLMDFGRAA